MTQTFTLIDDGHAKEVRATVAEGRVRLPEAEVERALCWHLEPQGLCRGDTCIPVRDPAALGSETGLDLEELARLLSRPLALDAAAGAAALAESATDRASALASLEAPDFTLPDLAGTPHTLSDHRGKKVLLIAYASW
jgi:hypothetical protein